MIAQLASKDAEAIRGSLSFEYDGAERFDAALSLQDLAELEAALSHLPDNQAGLRLVGVPGLMPLLDDGGVIGAVAAKGLKGARPVRALLFDKTQDLNWALGWHQDRTIAVRKRIDVPGYSPWTVKAGFVHVAPPFEVLANMITLRVHLDRVPIDNAPLRIVPGSARLGRIAESDVPGVVRAHGEAVCLAEKGDVWLYETPILHASDAAKTPQRRRVLQVDFAAYELPGGLQWLGV